MTTEGLLIVEDLHSSTMFMQFWASFNTESATNKKYIKNNIQCFQSHIINRENFQIIIDLEICLLQFKFFTFALLYYLLVCNMQCWHSVASRTASL